MEDKCYQMEDKYYQMEDKCYQMEEYYDVNYQVKYNEIRQELLDRLSVIKDDPEETYTEEDIECICKKLYLDEIASVFKSNDFLDDKVDDGFRKVFKLLMRNEEFETYINNLTISYVCENPIEQLDEDTYNNLKSGLDKNMTYFSFLSLFDMKIFYLTHQLIYHYLKNNLIDNITFEKIKKINDILSKKSE
jgi:hypothetical protein